MLLYELYTSQPDGESKFHGGGEYGKKVFEECVEQSNGVGISVCFDVDAFLDEWLLDLIARYSIPTYDVKSYSDIKRLIKSGKFKKIYSPMPYWIDQSYQVPEVILSGTVHGLRSIECPDDRYSLCEINLRGKIKRIVDRLFLSAIVKRRIGKMANVLNALDEIFTVSNHSRFAIENEFGDNLGIDVFYSPEKRKIATDADPISNNPIPNTPYILMIGCNRWEKNAHRGVLALDNLFSKGHLKQYKVICCGAKSTKLLSRINNREKFLSLGYVEIEELEYLYKNCTIFLYPTLNEGFGYPPLEAMAYGKTCVVSGTCSLPEICGNAVYYINPYNVREIETRVLEAVKNPISNNMINGQLRLIRKKQNEDLVAVAKKIIWETL